MTVSDFVRGLIRVTATKEAKWRPSRARGGVPPQRAYLGLGPLTFVLSPFGGKGGKPLLIEQGNNGHPATVLDAPAEVAALARFVREALRKELPQPIVLGGDAEVEELWEQVMTEAQRVRGQREQEWAEQALWRRGQKG